MKINRIKPKIDSSYSDNPILYDCGITSNFREFLNNKGINLNKYEINHINCLTLAIEYELYRNLNCSNLGYESIGHAQLIANGIGLLYSINNDIDDLATYITVENNQLKVNLIKTIDKG